MAAIATGIGDAGIASGPGGGGGGDMESQLGALLNSSETGEVTGDSGAPGGEGGSEPALPSETGLEAPGGEAPQQSPAEAAEIQPDQQAQPADNAAEPIPGWKQNQDGTYTVPATELPRVQSALQYAESVGQYFATPQDAQVASSTASQMRQMQNDWIYGTDKSIQDVMNFLSGAGHHDPAGRMAFSRSFSRMMQMAPDALKNVNPQAYGSLVNSFGQRLYSGLYDKAAEIAAQYGPDSEPAKQALINAQSVEWGMTGKYQTELPKVDPQARERQAFEQQQRDFQQRQESAFQRDSQAFNNRYLEGAEAKQLDAAIIAKLAVVKDKFPEVALQDIVAGIRGEVMQQVAQQGDWYTEHRQALDGLMADFRTVWQNGMNGDQLRALGPRINAYAQDFMARANRVLPAIAQKRINAATQARVNAASTRPRTQTGQFANANPGANSATAQPNTPRVNGNQNGTTERRSDKFDREWSAQFAPFRG